MSPREVERGRSRLSRAGVFACVLAVLGLVAFLVCRDGGGGGGDATDGGAPPVAVPMPTRVVEGDDASVGSNRIRDERVETSTRLVVRCSGGSPPFATAGTVVGSKGEPLGNVEIVDGAVLEIPDSAWPVSVTCPDPRVVLADKGVCTREAPVLRVAARCTLSVRIVDDGMRAIPGIAYWLELGKVAQRASDAEGNLEMELTEVPRVVVYAKGFVPRAVLLADLPGHPWALERVEVMLHRGGVVEGLVTDAGGQPVAFAEVLVSSPIRDTSKGQEVLSFRGAGETRYAGGIKEIVETDAAGRFVVSGVDWTAVGQVQVRVPGRRTVGSDVLAPVTKAVTSVQIAVH